MSISFSFSLEKLIHALAFFSKAGVKDLTKLKAAKLLYFADKEHLLRYGRPILGDVYFCLPYGPVPSLALNEMNDAIATPEVEDEDRGNFRNVVRVRRPFLGGQPCFESRHGFDPEVFSESEIEVLNAVTKKFGRLTAGQLVDLTHKEPTWTIPNKCRDPHGREPIPYELFFCGAPQEAQQVLAVLQAEQEEAQEFDAFLDERRQHHPV